MFKEKRQSTVGAAANLRPEMTFTEAAANWIRAMSFNQPSGEDAKPRRNMGFVGWRTLRDYKICCKALDKHFGPKRLKEITAADIREYQEKRAAGVYTNQDRPRQRNMSGPGPCANHINKEIALLLRMLKFSAAWTPEMFYSYMPLQHEEPEQQRAMTLQEQAQFLRVAASKDKWARVYWYSVLCLHSTMSTNEMRGLRLRDIDLSQAVIIVRPESAKNKYRIRTIPLDPEALKAATALIELARERGSVKPEHFIFSFRNKRGDFNPCREMGDTGLRKQWDDARNAADLPWLRMYDLRHTAITRLAEAGTPIQVIMDMAGHVSLAMNAHYTHISQQAKRLAVDNSSTITQLSTASKGKKPNAAFRMIERADSGQTRAGLSVSGVISAMKKLGIPAEQILEIIEAGQGAA